jgi:transposase InsO family protein
VIKDSYPHVGLGRICRLFGITRQAYYKNIKYQKKTITEDHIVLQLVSAIRKDHPRMGGRKLYFMIKEDINRLNIKIGRDALFDLLAAEHLLVQRRKRKHITTNSNHWYRKYPNLIKNLVPNGPNQIWVSDITYIRTKQEFLYLFLITDAYSKKILGYRLAKNLDSTHAVNSLQDAIKNTCQPISGLIHHSDRGIQYCSKEYTDLLNKHAISISMTENGDPLENPIAERINGILKDEYLYDKINNHNNLDIIELSKSIEKYNTLRPHLSCEMLTPQQAHRAQGNLKRMWKNYYRKRVNLEV